MQINCTKYQWATGTEDIDINFFSDVLPSDMGTIDLYDHYVDNTMSEVEYSFEDIDDDNTLYVKTSDLSFDCYENNVLFDFFECYTPNKYLKFKVEFYDDDNNKYYTGIIYKDGVNVPSVADKILSIIVIGYEKEFRSFFSNVPIIPSGSIPFATGGATGLSFATLWDVLRKNFANVSFVFNTALNIVFKYKVALNPFTVVRSVVVPGAVPLYPVEDYGGLIHIKTGYNCFEYDKANKFAWLNSTFLPMGWIWYFYLEQLIIQDRASTVYPLLEIDCNEVEVSQSLTHNYNQFQVDNVVIKAGEYFDDGSNRTSVLSLFSIFDASRGAQVSRNLGGEVAYTYSNINPYSNRTRIFRDMTYGGSGNYLMTYYNHNFRTYSGANDYNIDLKEITISQTSPYNIGETVINYGTKKSIVLNPYINSRENSGGFDRENVFADDGGYYGYGNYYLQANLPVTKSMGNYTGSGADSLIGREITSTGNWETYEFYTQTDTFKRNFKKFLKTNDEVIIEMEIKQLITNPLQTIRFINYQDADIGRKSFSIIRLAFHPIEKTTSLTLQMIQ